MSILKGFYGIKVQQPGSSCCQSVMKNDIYIFYIVSLPPVMDLRFELEKNKSKKDAIVIKSACLS